MTKKTFVTGAAVGGLLVACTGSIPNRGAASGGPGAASGGGRSGGAPSGAAGEGFQPTFPPLTGGNELDAKQAFACNGGDRGHTPQRLVRLTARQHANSVAAFINGRRAADAGPPKVPGDVTDPFAGGGASPADRFTTYGTIALVGAGELPSVVEVADIAAGLFVAQLHDHRSCLDDANGDYRGCVSGFLKDRGPLLFRRPLTSEELDAYTRIATDNRAAAGTDGALALAAQAMLAAPQFLFRTELGEGSGDERKLSPHEIAAALALALTDAPPDQPLWDAAQANALGSADQIAAQVARLLGKVSDNGAALRFFREYFRYDKVTEVFKDAKDFPFHSPTDLLDDTDQWVASVLDAGARKNPLAVLLTSNQGIVRSTTAKNYGLDADALWDKFRNAPQHETFAPGQRAGLLTQPSFLVGFSESTATKPVQRGRFVSESLLCRDIPEKPIGNIPPLPDLGPNATMRQKLAQHSQGGCAGCHALMDPLGLPFELYDHVGRYAPTAAGGPIDASGKLTGTDDQDGDFAGPLELEAKLAASSTTHKCFVRHVFRFWLGRNEQAEDACSLAAAYDAYQKGGGDLVALVTSLFTSRSFLTRVVVN